MAAPELVVADAPFKVYPGGVIALRATDWLGAARGTLTTEIDTRAITGEVVRDTQTVANSLFSADAAAFAAAADTISIDLSTLPLEFLPAPAMTYCVFVSYLIEGDWDQTNSDTFRAANQAMHSYACQLTLSGVAPYTGGLFLEATYLPRYREHFICVTFGGSPVLLSLLSTQTLVLKAYSRTGTTTEFLIDQILLLPEVQSGTKAGQWTTNDFAKTGGIGDPDISGDGVDGGDDNGQYTLIVSPEEEAVMFASSDGGGDYQRKATYASAEYTARVPTGDILKNSQTGDEASAVAYSICGQNYRPARVHHTDTFTRTVNAGLTQPGAWEDDDLTPEGFGLVARGTDTGGGPTYCSVNGTEGVMHMGGQLERSAGCVATYGGTLSTYAQLRMVNFAVSSFFYVDNLGSASFSATTEAHVTIRLVPDGSGSGNYELVFDLDDKTWRIVRSTGAAQVTIFSPVDISAWFTPDSSPSATVGFRFEIKRHLLRVKVWDASGAEPGAWGAEIFRPYYYGPFPGTNWYDYPYLAASSPETIGASINKRYWVEVLAGHSTGSASALTTWEVHWDDLTIEEDPYGDSTDITVAVERPEGTNVGQLVIPEGAQYPVHWGTRDWTEPDGGNFAVDYSVRVWNPTTAAELQRAELLFFWFRRWEFTLVSMNWREADRSGEATRVLVGGSGR